MPESGKKAHREQRRRPQRWFLRKLRPLIVNRFAAILISVLVGAFVGWFGVAEFGKNLRIVDKVIPGLGIIQRIQLPLGVLSRKDVLSFEIELNDADDFARAYVNNYVSVNTERPGLLVHFSDQDPRSEAQAGLYAVQRGHNRGRLKAQYYLRKGYNDVVVELENRTGPCGTGYILRVNDLVLRGVPASVGDSLDEIKNLADVPASGDLTDVLCSRRIFQFELE